MLTDVATARRFSLVIVALVAALPLVARGQATTRPSATKPASSQPAVSRVAHHLRVLDESNRPVAGADIWIAEDYPSFPVCLPDRKPANASVESTPDGAADFIWPTGLKCNLIVRASGHVPTFVRGVALTPDRPYTLYMKAGQPITGVIRDRAGKPIVDAKVKAVPEKFLLDYMSEFIPTGVTDAQGRFRLEHAAAGRHTVSAFVERSDPPVYTEPLAVDVPVDRPPAPLEMVALPGAALKGRFVTTQDIQLGGREVFLSIRVPRAVTRQLRTGPDGSFTVDGIPPTALGVVAFFDVGNYIAVMEWPKPPPTCRTDMAAVHFSGLAPGVYDGITVHLYKPGTYSAVFRDEKGKPHEKLGVVVEPWNRIFYTDANGHVAARIPPNVDVTLRYLNTFDEKVDAVRLAEDETVERDFTRARPPKPVYDHEITGQVVDEQGAPVDGVRVYLGNHGVVPQGDVRSHDPKPTWESGSLSVAHTLADAQGKFRFNLLLPGKTDLWTDRQSTHWAVARDVDSNSNDVKLVLRPKAAPYSFTGTVSDAAGQPVGGTRVCMFNWDNAELPLLAETRTAADGRFEISLAAFASGRSRELRMVARSDAGDLAWKVLPTCGVDDIRLQFRPPAAAAGRLVDSRGQPLGGARVWLYYGQDAAMGNMMFHTDILPLSPSTTTDADGRFVLRGLPKGATVSIRAKHPEYDQADAWYVKDVGPDTTVPDLKARDGITVEGTVRFVDNRPAPGATVTIQSFNRTLASVTTDAAGAYRVAGLENMSMRSARLTATLGTAKEWEGTPEIQTNNLYAGDHARGIDITLGRSLAWRRAQWLGNKAPAPQSRARVVVIDDADPATEGKPAYDDTIALLDSEGNSLWQQKGLGVAWGRPAIAWDPNDRAVYVYNYLDRRIAKFGADGQRLPWQAEPLPKGQSIASLAVDAENGDLWALTTAGQIYGHNLIVFDRQGKRLREHNVAGNTIVYSPHDKCFWVTGKRLMKVGRDGKVILEPSVSFAWVSRQLAVNADDGSVWVSDESHPEVHDSHNRLFVIAADGQVRTQVDLGQRRPGQMAVDPAHRATWVMFYPAGLTRLSLDGKVLAESPVIGDFTIEADTGCPWVSDKENLYRLASDGGPIWSRPTGTTTNKTLMAVGP
jgi:protocatechuate 3,4-dioxygenase beta subunit/DNA-binding beta-propeller fold protein YncE